MNLAKFKIIFILLTLAVIVAVYMLSIKNEKRDEGEKRAAPLQLRVSIPYWDAARAGSSLKNNLNVINEAAFFWYYVNSSGKIKKYQYANEDIALINQLGENNLAVTAVITNLADTDGSGWDSKRIENIITIVEKRQEHISDIVNLINENNFDGVSIDYERLDAQIKDDFSDFIAELSRELHKSNKFVGVALHPKTGENIASENNGSRAQDWIALSRHADALYLMTYGQHWDGSHPGPIASYNWVKDIIRYTQKLKLPPQKIYLGIPLYGLKWETDSEEAFGLTYSDIAKLIDQNEIENIEWNEEARSPFFSYTNEDGEYEVWFENNESIAEKISLANKANFLGVTFWRLGGEDEKIWEGIKEKIDL